MTTMNEAITTFVFCLIGLLVLCTPFLIIFYTPYVFEFFVLILIPLISVIVTYYTYGEEMSKYAN